MAQTKYNTILKLVPKDNSETITILERLLADAREGKIIGLVGAAHYGGHEHAYFGCGSLAECQALGLLAAQRLAVRLSQ
jgi:hypothetical protein